MATSEQQQQQAGVSGESAVAEYEAFTFVLESEQLYTTRDAVVTAFATGIKKRVAVVTPEALLQMMLGDPELLAEISAVHRDVAERAAAAIASITGTTAPPQAAGDTASTGTPDVASAAGDLPTQQQQQQQQSTQDGVAAKRAALVKILDGQVWARLLEARLI
jgi:hypothetical protein